MISEIGSSSGLAPVRPVSSGTAFLATGAAPSAPTGATATVTGGGARGSLAAETARTLLATQEQDGRSTAANGTRAQTAAPESAADTLPALEAALDANGDGGIDWRDYVSSTAAATAIATPTVTGYTSTGSAATRPASPGQTLSLVA